MSFVWLVVPGLGNLEQSGSEPLEVSPCFWAFYVFCFHVGSTMGKRRKSKRVPIKKRTTNVESQPRLLLKAWKSIPSSIRWSVVTLTALITLLQGFPWLSIEEQSFLNPSNPYSQMFKVVNTGYIPITSVTAKCKSSFTANGSTIRNINLDSLAISHSNFADYLAHEGAATIPCFDDIVLNDVRTSKGATLEIEVTYAFYHVNLHFLRKSQIFRFQTAVGGDGNSHWVYVSPHDKG